MAVISKNQTFDSEGNIIDEEDFTLTDDQVLLLELAPKANDFHDYACNAYRHWDELGPEDKDKIARFLLGYYLTSAALLSIIPR